MAASVVPQALALWRPFTNKGRSPLRHDIVCLHTMVGTLGGSWAWANGTGRSYWHFGTSGTGEAWQCHPLQYRSAANLYGNPYIIPIENADMGPGFGPWSGRCGDVPPFTNAQVDRLVKLVAYLCAAYNIPPVLIPDTRLGRRGIAYHRQGIPGSPEWVPGSVQWSSAAGKCCPDWRRIRQTVDVIIPRVRKALNPPTPEPPTPTPEEDDVTPILVRDTQDRAWLIDGDGQSRRRVIGSEDLNLCKLILHARFDEETGNAYTNLPDSWIDQHVDVTPGV